MMNTTTPTRTAPRRLVSNVTALARLLSSPLAPVDYLDLFDPVRSPAALRARIIAVMPETRDAATLVLQPGPTWRRHVPGQYVRLGVDVDGVRHWRAYSLTSPPDRADGRITVAVKAIAGGTVSTHLVRRARPGDVVQLAQATGDFTLPVATPHRTLFVVAGSGVTPVMGMLRSRLADLDDVVVVHCATSADDAIFRAELRALDARGRLRLIERFTDRDGRLDADQLRVLVPDLMERQAWACGPGGLLDTLDACWQEAGQAERLHTERFQPAVVDAGEGGVATFAASGRAVEVDGATSLLDAGESAGALMPSGCRMGICFGCVVPLHSGAVRDLRTGAVTRVEPGDDVSIQTCISTAAGACQLDI